MRRIIGVSAILLFWGALITGCARDIPIPPTASFTASSTSGTIPLSVVLTDTSTPGSAVITTWAWNLGDGSASGEQNPSHTYTVAGTYTVALTVTTCAGVDTETKTDYITVGKETPTVTTWPTAGPITYGQTLAFSTLAGGEASIVGTFAFDAPGTMPSAGAYDAAVTFTPTDTTNYVTVSNTVNVTIGKATPTVTTWPAASAIPLGQTLASSALTGGAASVAGAFTFDVPDTAPPIGAYSAAVTFTPTDTMNYNPVAGSVTVNVSIVRFVRSGSSGDGTSWDTALGSIQAAVDAVAAEGGGEVWVAAGTYTATTTNVITMAEGVHLYGGFAGIETGRGVRDRETNKTIIDGESERRCVNGVSNATLDGFVLRNGSADFGGGLRNDQTSPVVSNCTLAGNMASISGGGMYNGWYSSPTVTNCAFTGNSAPLGGGMQNIDYSAPIVTNCTFIENVAFSSGGGMFNRRVSMPTVTNCLFVGNSASSGGGMCNGETSQPTVTNCTFTKNSASLGGAMSSSDTSTPTVTNCILWDDSASDDGDEIYNYSPATMPVITYSCIQGGHDGTGNISSDPLLIGTLGSNGHVRADSPCIDAGSATGAPGTDARGVTRPQGSGVDMGAYELDDSDGDGISDAWEMAHFGNLTGAFPMSDADGDGMTDLDESLYGADPFNSDSDGDGLCDGEEVAQGREPTIASGIRRVSAANTSGTEDGRSWATAFTSIQAALDAMGEGEVWVAAGTYTATGGNVVAMMKHIHLYGGFAGTETARDARDWQTNKTTIHGESARRCVRGANDATLDGFIIQNGYAADSGGGMYNAYCTPAVANCTFIGNVTDQSGGGIYNNHSSPAVANCTFTGNIASAYGGGMYNDYSSPTVANCTFTANAADQGGGINNNYCSPTVTNCTFTENVVLSHGGGMYNYYLSSPAVTDCTFTGNTAKSNGGGVYNSFESSPTLIHCTFSENTSQYGGGVCNDFCSPTVTNCTFTGNSVFHSGGGMYNNNNASPTVAIHGVINNCA